eukprot:Platyproteum_vivax@DN7552_c0_g1_i2.p1
MPSQGTTITETLPNQFVDQGQTMLLMHGSHMNSIELDLRITTPAYNEDPWIVLTSPIWLMSREITRSLPSYLATTKQLNNFSEISGLPAGVTPQGLKIRSMRHADLIGELFPTEHTMPGAQTQIMLEVNSLEVANFNIYILRGPTDVELCHNGSPRIFNCENECFGRRWIRASQVKCEGNELRFSKPDGTTQLFFYIPVLIKMPTSRPFTNYFQVIAKKPSSPPVEFKSGEVYDAQKLIDPLQSVRVSLPDTLVVPRRQFSTVLSFTTNGLTFPDLQYAQTSTDSNDGSIRSEKLGQYISVQIRHCHRTPTTSFEWRIAGGKWASLKCAVWVSPLMHVGCFIETASSHLEIKVNNIVADDFAGRYYSVGVPIEIVSWDTNTRKPVQTYVGGGFYAAHDCNVRAGVKKGTLSYADRETLYEMFLGSFAAGSKGDYMHVDPPTGFSIVNKTDAINARFLEDTSTSPALMTSSMFDRNGPFGWRNFFNVKTMNPQTYDKDAFWTIYLSGEATGSPLEMQRNGALKCYSEVMSPEFDVPIIKNDTMAARVVYSSFVGGSSAVWFYFRMKDHRIMGNNSYVKIDSLEDDYYLTGSDGVSGNLGPNARYLVLVKEEVNGTEVGGEWQPKHPYNITEVLINQVDLYPLMWYATRLIINKPFSEDTTGRFLLSVGQMTNRNELGHALDTTSELIGPALTKREDVISVSIQMSNQEPKAFSPLTIKLRSKVEMSEGTIVEVNLGGLNGSKISNEYARRPDWFKKALREVGAEGKLQTIVGFDHENVLVICYNWNRERKAFEACADTKFTTKDVRSVQLTTSAQSVGAESENTLVLPTNNPDSAANMNAGFGTVEMLVKDKSDTMFVYAKDPFNSAMRSTPLIVFCVFLLPFA